MYKLTDFSLIAKKNPYKLPSSVLHGLHALCTAIHAEPIFEFTQDIKQTKQDVTRELNKITETSSFDTFLSILTPENVVDFAEDIFTILTSNSYLMKTYCILFLKLSTLYPIFMDVFHQRLNVYKESFKTIRFGDPSEYILFCDINKENHSRKLFSQFITEFDQLDSTSYGYTICSYLLDYVDSLLSSTSKEVVYECIENVSILTKYTVYHKVRIERYCELDPSTTTGIHTKFIFTCMDILKIS
jgi:hypothetical protein